MKPGSLLMITAVIFAIIGISFVLIPGVVMSLFAPMAMYNLPTQLFGGFLIGFAVLNFSARNIKDREALRIILLANLVSSVITFFLALYYQLFGMALVTNWINIVLALLFAIGFAYFLLVEPRPSMANVPCPAEPC